MSISKLTKQFNCSVTFSSDSVVIQDLKTRRMIGQVHEAHGLYYLSTTSTIACTTASSIDIHCRLGHPSLANLKTLVPHLSSLQSLECQTCQLGKHHRTTFVPGSVQRVSSPFEVVHSDIWGSSRTPSLMGFRYFVTFAMTILDLHGYF